MRGGEGTVRQKEEHEKGHGVIISYQYFMNEKYSCLEWVEPRYM